MKALRYGLIGLALLAPLSSAAELAPRDAPVVETAIQRALESKESGDRQEWASQTGKRGYATPVRTWRSVSGHFCRLFQVWLLSDDSHVRLQDGVRCRDEAGLWIEMDS